MGWVCLSGSKDDLALTDKLAASVLKDLLKTNDALRGATWVALHNGGGVGWGEVINGGFGCVLDGTKVCRRSWSGNKYAYETIQRAMKDDPALLVTLPNEADEQLVKKVLAGRKL
ncbi:hypothetical protein MTO96_006402 [Rhipicephalus appendiculatus]